MSGPYTITIGDARESLLSPLVLPKATISAAPDAWSPVLQGTSGDDVFNPGTNSGGTAYMYGGPGNEVFYVSGFNQVVVAQPGGVNTIVTSYGWGLYTLPANVENLIYNGTASYSNGWITLQGNALNDTLVGNNLGVAFEAGTGNDTLVGGKGDDIFDIAAGDAGDTIIGLHAGDDVQLTGFPFTSVAALKAAMTQASGNVVVNLGGSQTLTLVNQTIAGLSGVEFDLIAPAPPVAEAPTLLVSAASGTAGKPVPLAISASLAYTDPGETLSVLIQGLPTGATLNAGTPGTSGTWRLTPAQLTGLTLTLPGSIAATDTLTVSAVATETDGSSATTTARLPVTVAAPPPVAQAPTLQVSAASGVVGVAVPLAINAALVHADPGETLSVLIEGLPTGAMLSAGTHDTNGSWTLTPAQLTGLTLTVPGSLAASDTLTVSASATEADGSAATTQARLTVTLAAPPPVAQAPALQLSAASGVLGTAVPLEISAALVDADPGETLSVLINGLPTGAILSAGSGSISAGWTLTPAQLTGLTLTAPGNVAVTDTLTVTALAAEIDGSTATTTGLLTVTLASPPPIAQAPTLQVAAASGTDATAVPLAISADLVQADPGETLSVLINGLPTGAILSAGTLGANGTWTLTPAQLAGLTLTVPGSLAATDTLTVSAVATETDGSTATTTAELAVTLAAPPLVAQAPILDVSPAAGTDGVAVPLAISADLVQADPGETLSVLINGLPSGATLSAGSEGTIGAWTLTATELTDLTLTVTGSLAATDSLTVSAVAVETDGSTATTTGTLLVTLAAPPPVAQAPTLQVAAASGTEGVAVPLVISASLAHTDPGETLSVLINGLPTGAILSAGTPDANGTWTLTPAQLAGLTLTAPGSLAATDTLTVSAVATETDGSTATTTAALAITLAAPPLVAQAPILDVSPAAGTDGIAVPLTISADLVQADPGETLSVLINGLPSGATLSAGSEGTIGAWTLTATELTDLTLTVAGSLAATDSLTVSAVAVETDGSTATTTGTLLVTLAAPPPVAQAPTLQVAAASGTEGVAVPLVISASLAHTDPGETLSVLINGLPSGATLSAGNQGATGSWTLTPAELAGLTLTVPGSIAATDTLTVSAVAAESDGSDASAVASLAVTLEAPEPTYSIILGDTQQNLLGPLTLPTPTISPANSDAESPVLTGTDGDDVFNPGTNLGGTAYMYGGTGNEVFYVPNSNDVVIAQPGGIDTIITAFGWGVYTLPDDVQNLIYDGNASYSNGWITLQGNALDDTLVANNNGIELDAGTGEDTLVGGTGDDIFAIAAGDAGDTIIGLHAGDTVALSGIPLTSFAALQTAMVQSGGNVVIDLGNGQLLTLVDQTIAGLSAAEFGLPAPSGASTSGGGTSGGGTSGGGTSGGGTSGSTGSLGGGAASSLVTAPAVPQADAPDQVVGFLLRNNATLALGASETTFTEVFAPGQVQATQGLVAIIGGQTLAVQMDVQTTNADGSVAMATLTMAQPALAAGATEGGMLSVVPTASTAAAVDLSTLSGQYQLGVDLTMHNADGSTTQYNLDAVSLLQQALANGTATYVLRGAQVSEVQFTTPIAGSLFLTFDISLYANGSVAADVQFDNDLAMSPVGGTANYDVAIVQNGGTVLDQTGITQYQYTTWQEQVGTGTMPQAQVVLDMNALEKTGALPNYDPTAGISASDIANEGSQLGGPTYDILGSASVTQYMPTTGGRADIGPQPGWDAVWLMTQDPTAEQFALAQANASGSVPWHFIDSGTGTYISVIQYPDLWVDPRASTSEGYTPLTQPVPAASLTGWTADPAHQPDLSYAAYLLTGNQYYLSELNAQASWAEADDWTPYRQGGAGLVANGADQLRQQAWSLREVDEAAYANPDGSAMKAYFTQLSDNNWQWLVSQIPAWTQIEGQASGWMPALYGETNDEVMAPWQQDYFASTAVQAAEMGNQDAVTFLTWESNFLVGRFLNAENGFNPRDGVAYNLTVGDTSGAIYTTWAGIENASVAAGESNGTGWAQSQGDYGELALQSLAGIITVLQSPDAIEAYGYLINSGVPDLGADPQLDIVPRLSDGNLLTASNIILSDDTTATTISGSNNDQLIEAGTGDDTVIGGSGINILFAGSGNDVLIGGPTADYLYAGSGNDTLSAGAGTNYMMAGSGSDLFQLTPNDVAQDTIVAFKLGVDHLQLLGGAGTSAFDAQVLSGATSDGNGGSVLHLTAVHTVTLTGINPSELTTAIYA